MSVLFTEGFDNMGASDGATYGKWFSAITTNGTNAATSSRSIITGRFGSGSALQMSGYGGVASSSSQVQNTYQLAADKQTLFLGFGFLTNGSASGVALFSLLDNAQTAQLDIRFDGTLHPYVTRNGTTLCTSSAQLTNNQWSFIELGAFISATTGWVELRVNSTLVASYYGTGTSRATANGNTQNSAVASVRYAVQGFNIGSGLSCTFQYDDVVINDNSGTVNNDFLGDVRVIGLLPNAGGTYSQLARTGGTASGNFTAVDENPIDGDTSYVATAAVGALDTYKYPSLPVSASQVLAVSSTLVAKRDDAGTRSVTTHFKSGASEADAPGASIALGVSYHITPQIMETNPVTGLAWTVDAVNAVEAGPKVTA